MDTTQWPPGNIEVVKHMEAGGSRPPPMLERRARPQKDQALNCPRCSSTNTKFCYYNNYSLSQPRYFCKTCRRYWTEGGSLRNVPVGGGSRKNKRSISSSTNSTSSSPSVPITTPSNLSSSQNPKIPQSQDLNIAYSSSGTADHHHHQDQLLKSCGNLITSRALTLGSLMSMSSTVLPVPDHQPGTTMCNSISLGGFDSLPEFNRPSSSLDFSLENGYGSFQRMLHDSSGHARLLFPIEDLNLKQQQGDQSTTDDPGQFIDQSRSGGQGDHSTGYWNGMLGGGSW